MGRAWGPKECLCEGGCPEVCNLLIAVPIGGLWTTPARKCFWGKSTMRNNMSADFCFRKSVCFQREKEGEKMAKTWKAQLKLDLMSLCLSCHQLFSHLVRERQQVLFTENSDDHGKEWNVARYSERLFGRRLLSHPGLRLLPAEQKNGCEMSAWEGIAEPQLVTPPPRGSVPGKAILSVLPVIPPAVNRGYHINRPTNNCLYPIPALP